MTFIPKKTIQVIQVLTRSHSIYLLDLESE